MITIKRVSSLRSAVNTARQRKQSIAFVPTMGNLHEGHLELVRVAKSRCEYVIVSIYVNPTQFGANEDLAAYPSTPEEDARKLAELEVDALFMPDHDTMYPGPLEDQTQVTVPHIGKKYCGEDRPQHFQGVTTVVSRLFNMVMPDVAVFGRKDYQQLAIIRRMVADLAYPIQIVGVDTVRDARGLALSSRNQYLTSSELTIAPSLRETLLALSDKLQSEWHERVLTQKRLTQCVAAAKSALTKAGFKTHYLVVCDRHSLASLKLTKESTKDTQEAVILCAATLGKARLLDNLKVTLEP